MNALPARQRQPSLLTLFDVAAERGALIGYFLLLFSTSASRKCVSTLRVAEFGENKWGFCQNPHSTFAETATINPKVGIPV
jgi:hypothetical protein